MQAERDSPGTTRANDREGIASGNTRHDRCHVPSHGDIGAVWHGARNLPDIEIDPETYTVTADGEVLTCEPAVKLPMAQRYFLF